VGPTGAAAPYYVATDGNGNTVGSSVVAFDTTHVTIWFNSSHVSVMYDTSGGIYTLDPTPIWYESSNCTGAAYTSVIPLGVQSVVYTANSVFYAHGQGLFKVLPGVSSTNITMLSYAVWNGVNAVVCDSTSETGLFAEVQLNTDATIPMNIQGPIAISLQ
jgi:hypothetical protein